MKQKNTWFHNLQKFFHFLTSVFLYAILTILVIIIITVVVYYIEQKQNLKKGDYTAPLFSAYVIISNSMEPNIHVNDAVVTRRVSGHSVEKGDIITFISESPISYGATITHRVVEVTQDSNGFYLFRTKGDNNNTEDSWLVPEDNLMGKVMFKIPKLGYLQQFLSTSYGWILVIVIPSLGVIIYDFIKLGKTVYREINKKRKKES